MIPKKIHYCWFSGDPFPPIVTQCIDTWRRHMPDYELILWDYDRIKDIESVWLHECLQERKWAFAADFVRLWAVYHEGGIYLDSDVFIHQSLDPFLVHSMFIGREGVAYPTFDDGIQVYLTSHCFGAEAGHPFLKLNLAYYAGRHFVSCDSKSIPNELRFEMRMMPYIQSKLAESFGYDPCLYANHIQHLTNGIVVYPDHFMGMGEGWAVGPESYAAHLGVCSWRESNFVALVSDSPPHFSLSAFPLFCKWYIVRTVRYFAAKFGYATIKVKPH